MNNIFLTIKSVWNKKCGLVFGTVAEQEEGGEINIIANRREQ